MALLQLQLGGVLDGDDAVVVAGWRLESALSSVVLPVPVPPEMRTFSSARMQSVEELDRVRARERAQVDQVVERQPAAWRTCGS